MTEQPNDLIIKMQQGDESAFAKLYEMYAKSIYTVIYVILKDPQITEEVLQDVFVKVWNNAQKYDVQKGRFYTWVLNIARNAAIDKTRSKLFKNENKTQHTDSFVDILKGTDNLSSKTDSIGLQSWVDKLKPICVKLIDFLYFKGYTQAEVAETMDTPLGTIKTRARTCIKNLRELLKEA